MKIRNTYETEVYLTKAGYLAIKQPDTMGGEDSVVLLSPEQARLVANEIHERAAEHVGVWNDGTGEEPEDPAPRG